MSGRHRGRKGGGGRELLPRGQQQLTQMIQACFSLARLSEEGGEDPTSARGPPGQGARALACMACFWQLSPRLRAQPGPASVIAPYGPSQAFLSYGLRQCVGRRREIK